MAARRFVFSSAGTAESATELRYFRRWFDEYTAFNNSREVLFRDDVPFAVEVDWLDIGGGVLARNAGCFRRVERRRDHAGRNSDGPIVLVINRGQYHSFPEGTKRSAKLAPGDAALFDTTRPSTHTYPGDHRSLALNIPRRRFLGAVRHGEDLDLATIPASNGVLRLLVHYANGLLDDAALSEPAVVEQVADHLLDLTVLALGTDRDATETARNRGLRAARLAAVLSRIRASYVDSDISPELVAQRIGISTRYLHDLLHETGQSFSERVQELRLARAFTLLGRHGSSRRKIADIAYEAGFNDLSYFNRSFRRKYGLTPSSARGRSAAVEGGA